MYLAKYLPLLLAKVCGGSSSGLLQIDSSAFLSAITTQADCSMMCNFYDYSIPTYIIIN